MYGKIDLLNMQKRPKCANSFASSAASASSFSIIFTRCIFAAIVAIRVYALPCRRVYSRRFSHRASRSVLLQQLQPKFFLGGYHAHILDCGAVGAPRRRQHVGQGAMPLQLYCARAPLSAPSPPPPPTASSKKNKNKFAPSSRVSI